MRFRGALRVSLAIVAGCLLGATMEGSERLETPSVPIHESPLTDFDRDHWSYRPITRPELPAIEASQWPRTPVDVFVLHRLQRAELLPAPPADRATLLRRVKFDLLGLPPTPDELARFECDRSPRAYERLVDRFLASPAYGERWAQYWLDLARFAETDGFEHDKVRTNAWKYRQWVIEALNHDLSYDQFVRLQLSGDLTGRAADAIATMFCLAGPDMPDINDQDLRRHDKLNEITSTVGAALLGLQLHCAQCHDHKYDPISQADFYRFRAVFAGALPDLRRDRPIEQLAVSPRTVAARLYLRGELSNRGPIVEPRPPRIASTPAARRAFDATNPRIALVDWLFSEDNFLTARVIANRIWQHHFGRSLCENPSDLGVVAGGPSHPELLDWLASDLRRSGWSLKHLHRRILLSSVYRQASYPRPDQATVGHDWSQTLIQDPANELLGRFPRIRLEGEVIRDALLAVAGQLNGEFGGPSVLPPLPDELRSTLLGGQWPTSAREADHYRRSIYVFARRNLRYPLFEVFDRPDAGVTCARRDRSTTPLQSLHLLNSQLSLECAEGLRDRLLRERSAANPPWSSAELVERLFRIAFGRPPQTAEAAPFCQLLAADTAELPEQLLVACLAVLNASEFIYVD